MIETGTRQFRRLNAEMGQYKDDEDPALISLQADSRRIGQQLMAWKREHDKLEAEVSAEEMTVEEEQVFLADIAALRAGMIDADYVNKTLLPATHGRPVQVGARRGRATQAWCELRTDRRYQEYTDWV